MVRLIAHGRRTAGIFLVLLIAATAAQAARSQPANARHVLRGTTAYISKRYGYKIALTGQYTMIQALLQWDGSFPFGSSGMVDITLDSHDRKFIVAAKRVPPGMSLARWQAFVVGVKRQNCTRLRNFRSTSLGGVPAREFVNTCPGYDVITLAALHKGRGYLLEYLAPTNSSAASDRRTYEAGRRAFQFTRN
jgi:hypothetical protein